MRDDAHAYVSEHPDIYSREKGEDINSSSFSLFDASYT